MKMSLLLFLLALKAQAQTTPRHSPTATETGWCSSPYLPDDHSPKPKVPDSGFLPELVNKVLPKLRSSWELHQELGTMALPLAAKGVHSLIILDFDDCIFPTSFQSSSFWKAFGTMNQKQKAWRILHVRSMLTDYDDYLANRESPLRSLLADGCTVEIATNANQSWIDLAMSFLPKTRRLLREYNAYPREEEPLPIPSQQLRGGTEKKINRHKDIVEKFMRSFRTTNLGRGLIMAVGDHHYDVAPLQTFMRHKSEWLASKSRREIDGYTIKMRNLYQCPGYIRSDQVLRTHKKEMKHVLHTMRTIFNMHNNQALWLAHAQKLRDATIDAEKALNNALRECAEKRYKRIAHCIPWVAEILDRKLRDKKEKEVFDKVTSEFQDACAQMASSSERCRELGLQHQKTQKRYNTHTRTVINNWHTVPYKDDFAAVPNERPTSREICREIARHEERLTRFLIRA